MPVHDTDSHDPIYTARFTLDGMTGTTSQATQIYSISAASTTLAFDKSGEGPATDTPSHTSTTSGLASYTGSSSTHSTGILHPIVSPIAPFVNITASNITIHSSTVSVSPSAGVRISGVSSTHPLIEFGAGLAVGFTTVFLVSAILF